MAENLMTNLQWKSHASNFSICEMIMECMEKYMTICKVGFVSDQYG